MSGLKSKAVEMGAKWLGGRFLGDIEAGKLGPPWLRRAVVAAKGYKSATGFVLAALLAGTAFYEPDLAARLAPAVGTLSGLLIHYGLLDKAWSKTPPPPWVSEVLGWLTGIGGTAALALTLFSDILAGWPDCAPCTVWQGRIEDWGFVAGAVVLWMNRWVAAWSAPSSEQQGG